MKLARRLESQLQKFVFLAVGLGVVILLITTAVSLIDTREKAKRFIVSHLANLSSAEINSQNVSQIDGAVRRLYDTWTATQDIDIRADVFLDDKLVGHAGQLSDFGLLSIKTASEYHLPSGQKLAVLLQMDLFNRVVLEVLTLMTLIAFIFICYILLRKGLYRVIHDIASPLEKRVNWLTAVSRDLPESIREAVTFEKSPIAELRSLDQSLLAFTKQILRLEERVAKESFDHGRLKMAEQLAHHMKGSLGLMRLRVNNAASLSGKERASLLTAITEVSEAAKNILESRRAATELKDAAPTVIDVIDLLEKAVARAQAVPGIKITGDFQRSPASFVKGDSGELRSTLGNIIDNAVDALNGKGEMTVLLRVEQEQAEISISDNGCGIPPEILPRLMMEGATFGKANGNGLGLFHARTTVERMGGTIRIESTVGKGTTVRLRLPLESAAVATLEEAKAVEEISVLPGQTLVVVDDDPRIHEAWADKLRDWPASAWVNLYSAKEFRDWLRDNGPGELGSRLYLMDFDLGETPTENGLALVRDHGIQFESVLVTGAAERAEVKTTAAAIGVRVLSKDQLTNIELRYAQ